MKRLLQISLLLLLIASARAQETQSEVQKALRVYDWNELAQQHELSGGEIVNINGTSVLKIENTNNAPLEISLLKIKSPSAIEKASDISFDMKFENVRNKIVEHQRLIGGFGHHIATNTYTYTIPESSTLSLLANIPPAASGGDERTNNNQMIYIYDTSNWQPHDFDINTIKNEGLPTELELRLSLVANGTVYLRPIKLIGVVDNNWWTTKQSGQIGGIGGILGGIIGCFGGLIGCLASMGKARNFVLTTVKVFIALGITLTLTGIIAILCGQPYFVWYVFLLPGVILTLVFSLNLPTIQRRYDDLEIRRIASLDALGS